jgi:arylsulfatase A-like enzyme/tetratricopeptide (TPR) repeat protein
MRIFNRVCILILILLLVFACGFLESGCQISEQNSTAVEPAAPWRPLNVVIVTIDTLRADRLGCYGYSQGNTPHLDHLAAQGVLFENATASAPATTPSHASMFTGTYPPVHGVRNAGGFALSPSKETLAEMLQAKGWQTAAFVGASVLDRVYGLNQGFSHYDDRMPDLPGNRFLDEASRPAEHVVDHAIDWLDKQATSSHSPFFLWVHVYDPHAPHDPPASFKERYRLRPYDGEIAYTDQQLGRLFAAINRKSPADKTVLMVLADHGESLSEHGEYYHGVFLYESTLRIPWFIIAPGLPAGLRVKAQARTVDLLPTVMALLQAKTPSICQGTSLLPALSGKEIPTTYSYSEALYPKLNMGWAELRGMRTNHWKYVMAPRPELYNLESDPGELHNVIEQHPDEVKQFRAEIQKIVPTQGDSPTEQVQIKTISNVTEKQLESLGYVSAGPSRQLKLTGEGADPKDRTHILKLLDDVGSLPRNVSASQRIQLLNQARNEDPTNPALYYLLGDLYAVNRRSADALRIYELALRQKATTTSKIYSRMAAIYGEQGRLDEAILALESALDIDPTDIGSHGKLAEAYLLKGRLPDAERILKLLLEVDSENPEVHNNMGWIALKRGDRSAARQHFERALQVDSNWLEAYLNLGTLFTETGDYSRARASYEAYLSRTNSRSEIALKVRNELARVMRKQRESVR